MLDAEVLTAPPAAPARPLRLVGGWLWRVLCWTLILLLGAVLAAAVLVPRLAGATTYTVLTGSMGRAHPPGSLIVVRPVDPAEIRLGQVVTYQLRSGEPTVVTHRVVASRQLDGERAFVTQGDVNAEPDAELVRAVQVRGVVWYTLPWLGYVNNLLTGSVRLVVVQLGALALAGYAVVMFVGALRDRRGSGVRARPRRAR
ncbi:signal peptidase I [Auraticoccus sp. F435]|uniref:Signal peptidase I n=1 Tax=Auraticoccus cholistanensis TaxID=2656650 RepID=A0A6A9UQ89_9ACTN|nr:signal peptidase I [Auraticoccus cholistanensis]MVA74718.1 signal peptidase I [Auraticoccus cholistanensis]